jgi:N6-L-threonylcarbamoyladenine synthase
MRILAIETSCDETAAAILEDQNFQPKILTNIVASQIKVHAETGGVIPNIAARLHVEAMPLVLEQATHDQKLSYGAVAVTVGPGLIGSLLVGVAAAKTIALAKKIPFYAINHLEGHIYSAWLGETVPELPALIVIVSGGHTELIYMPRHLHYEHLGHTRDDAAGEAFDKIARLLDLPYPGGPNVAKLALHGARDAYKFPISLLEKGNLEFSFSGIKANVAHLISQLPKPLPEHTKADIAASFEQTVAETISIKTVRALKMHEVKTVCLVGGVSANIHLRKHLEQAVHQENPEIKFIVPPFQFCTDNAAMIGAAAIHHHLFGKPDDWQTVQANPGLEL